MLRYSLRRVAAASTGTFSSAAFTGEDGGAYNTLKGEQERLQRHHQGGSDGTSEKASASSAHSSSEGANTNANASSSSSSTCSDSGSSHFGSSASASFSTASVFMGNPSDTALERPTIDTYIAMTDDQLVDTLRLRDDQITQLRAIYENFHYDADKHFRKMIFDYHDKTMQLSQVHGKMQQASLQINREALARMRDEQDRMTRDKRLIFTLCTIWSVVFWVWVRRHYVLKKELTQESFSVQDRERMTASITGAGSYGNNFFGSNKRNARFAETAWEREVRERREAEDGRERQMALLQHQSEVQKAVAARDGSRGAAVAAEKITA